MNTEKTQIVWIGKRKHCKEKLTVTKDLVWGKDTFNLLGIQFSVDLDLVISLNYDPILDDISKSLSVWRKRFLTPLGKITVLKTLILSKLNHLFMSIPNPDQSVINKLQSTFFQFIWDDKPDKIGRKQLCSDYMRGGLCMIDLENFICSLKCTWMRRLLTQKHSPWYELCLYNLKDYEKCFNLHSLWHKTLAKKITNKFWKSILLSWAKVIDSLSKDQNNKVLNSPLWYNPIISAVPLFYQHWYNKGIIFTADLFCESKLLSLKDLTGTLKIKTNFLEYHRVKTCLKKNFTIHPQDPIVKPVWPTIIEILTKSKKGSKDFYKLLTNTSHLDTLCYKAKWEAEVGDKLDHEDWKTIYKHCFKVIQDNEIIWLQYRIINRILGTKVFYLRLKNKIIICVVSVPAHQKQYHMYLSSAPFCMNSGKKPSCGFMTL